MCLTSCTTFLTNSFLVCPCFQNCSRQASFCDIGLIIWFLTFSSASQHFLYCARCNPYKLDKRCILIFHFQQWWLVVIPSDVTCKLLYTRVSLNVTQFLLTRFLVWKSMCVNICWKVIKEEPAIYTSAKRYQTKNSAESENLKWRRLNRIQIQISVTLF